jgi:glycerate kinase
MVLIAVESFGEGCPAARAGGAIARGLSAADPRLTAEVCPIESGREGGEEGGTDGREKRGTDGREDAGRLLGALHFDARMRAARAVVLGVERLDERTLPGSATFEAATRARQAGVPAYAVTAENQLTPFDARILDLQVVLQARDTRALRRAGEKLAGLV